MVWRGSVRPPRTRAKFAIHTHQAHSAEYLDITKITIKTRYKGSELQEFLQKNQESIASTLTAYNDSFG
jgi:hypothetical protein